MKAELLINKEPKEFIWKGCYVNAAKEIALALGDAGGIIIASPTRDIGTILPTGEAWKKLCQLGIWSKMVSPFTIEFTP